ncbi:MAG: alpha/beta fold hydrolase [Firmicutes bacterium]|nr:alpha/beta fold hydrolase [Bacillota bacterium]
MKYTMRAKSPTEIGALLQEGQERWLQVTKRWLEILTLDPRPQTGCTPKDIIWRKNKSKLYHYHSSVGRKYRTPVLFIYALINRAYILDLTPGMSIVEYLVDDGFDVYMLEWGDFNWEDRNLSFADLVFDYIAQAVKRVTAEAESENLTIIGYCMGGTMATMYTALFEKPRVQNLIYIATPVDFTDAGISSIWLAAPAFNADRVADTFQLIPRDFIDMGTRMLNPVNNYLGTYTRLWKLLDEGLSVHSWKVLNKWMSDGINFPGEAYRQWIKEFYQENRLVKNQIVLRGRTVHLQRIKSNLLALVGQRDHIVLPHQTAAALEYLGSREKTYLEFPVGHGGLVFGKAAREQVFPTVAEWLRNRSEKLN